MAKNTKLAASREIRAKLRTNPTPSPGKSLKLTFKCPNNPYKNKAVKTPITTKINKVKVAGGSTLVSGGLVRMIFGGL